MAENFRNGRHGSPSKEFQSLFFHDDLKHLFLPGSVSAHFVGRRIRRRRIPVLRLMKNRGSNRLWKRICAISATRFLLRLLFYPRRLCRLYVQDFLRFLMRFSTVAWDFSPLMFTTAPIPQLSCSKEERYSPSSPMTRSLLCVIRLPFLYLFLFSVLFCFPEKNGGEHFIPRRSFWIALTILYFFHPVKSKFNFYIIFLQFFFTFLGYCCILHNFLTLSIHYFAAWYSAAAAIRPRNSGCGRFGRDLNSGCACVAM